MKQPDLFRKNQRIGRESEKNVVTNPALTLSSAIFLEKGKELEQIITDAETKFIMGKIDGGRLESGNRKMEKGRRRKADGGVQGSLREESRSSNPSLYKDRNVPEP